MNTLAFLFLAAASALAIPVHRGLKTMEHQDVERPVRIVLYEQASEEAMPVVLVGEEASSSGWLRLNPSEEKGLYTFLKGHPSNIALRYPQKPQSIVRSDAMQQSQQHGDKGFQQKQQIYGGSGGRRRHGRRHHHTGKLRVEPGMLEMIKADAIQQQGTIAVNPEACVEAPKSIVIPAREPVVVPSANPVIVPAPAPIVVAAPKPKIYRAPEPQVFVQQPAQVFQQPHAPVFVQQESCLPAVQGELVEPLTPKVLPLCLEESQVSILAKRKAEPELEPEEEEPLVKEPKAKTPKEDEDDEEEEDVPKKRKRKPIARGPMEAFGPADLPLPGPFGGIHAGPQGINIRLPHMDMSLTGCACGFNACVC